ncbi:MAG: cytochrome C [Dehalococcoidales bacterium]|nr:cytochrome C [Dehalococcoidales bacterium]
MKLKLGYNRVLVIGLIMGVAASAAQAFFQVIPPVADGISFLGHPRGLLNWIVNNLFGTDLAITKAFIVYPPLTVIGVFIGSFVAAARNKELRLRPGPVRKKVSAGILGFLVANFGLLWGACPIRTALLVSYGSVLATIALASIVIGVILAGAYMQSSAKRGISQ